MIGAQDQVESLLISELRHRLANSFQLLQAVIRIRLRTAADPESRRHLSWLLDVVTALGMLQQRVGVAAPSDFGAYLIEAAAYWRRVCDGRPIDIVVNVQTLQVPEAQASTLALIAHELISNCIEHAFPNGRPGVIELSFGPRSDGAGVLVVRDNGDGLAAPGAASDRQGLELVHGLAAHLGGAVAIDGRDGTMVQVICPLGHRPRPH